MLLTPALLPAGQPLWQAFERLRAYAFAHPVVIIERGGEVPTYYLSSVEEIGAVAVGGVAMDVPLTLALGLEAREPLEARQIYAARPAPVAQTVLLLDGDSVVGLQFAGAAETAAEPSAAEHSDATSLGEGARESGGSEAEPAASEHPPEPSPSVAPAAPSAEGESEDMGRFRALGGRRARDATPPAPPAEAPAAPRPVMRGGGRRVRGPARPASGDGDEARERPLAEFRAWPAIAAPDAVGVDEEFIVRVRLRRDRPVDAAGREPIVVAGAGRRFDLVVQIIAPDFDTPAGARRFLHVDRDDPQRAEAQFRLVTRRAVEALALSTIEFEFSYAGQVCGRAWREISLLPAKGAVPQPKSPDQGSSSIRAPSDVPTPDLTVSITEGEEDGQFVWTFASPHPIAIPEASQVVTRLDNHNARSFANHVMQGIPANDQTRRLTATVLGAGRMISDEMPAEFWSLLAEVWRIARNRGRTPSLLLLSTDPYVPWELASLEEDYLEPELQDPVRPPVLGAQLSVGRWLPPRRRSPRGGEWPVQPPNAVLEVSRMGLMIGDYLANSGLRDLPEAKAEGDTLAQRYRAVRMKVEDADVSRLLDNRITEDGHSVAIQAVHLAAHGQRDMHNEQYNGIVLNDGYGRLDAMTARGNRIGKASHPFIFLNACEVGTAGQSLGYYGGLAASFLCEGFTAFIAPLWAVNDTVARQIAEEFYLVAINQSRPIGDALRDLRSRFDMNQDTPAATYLAYIYYGHPQLRLQDKGVVKP